MEQKVLALFANPRGTDPLRLGEEDRTIRECFRRGRRRDEIQLTVRHAVTVDDIRRALLDDDFTIVHFSGHGTDSGLLLEDHRGGLFVPPQEALAELLAEYAPPLMCAVLNACYSLAQGEQTSIGLPFTVAMESPIADRAALIFSEAFYDSIGAGKDVEFSFRQGVHALRLANHPHSRVPVLLKQGERWHAPSPAVPERSDRSVSIVGTERTTTLVGVALDVSGSMEDSFDNRNTDVSSRLNTAYQSLSRNLDARALRDRQVDGSAVRVFAYAFGLRSGAVCDLFSLLEIADQVVDDAEIERLACRHEAELRAEYAGGGLDQLGGLAEKWGLSAFVKAAEQFGENEVRRRVAVDVQRRLAAGLTHAGDTTLTLDQLTGFWGRGAARLGDTEPLIYGNTPMCEALRAVRDRFTRELGASPDAATRAILLVISDGQPTDGDPGPVAAEIRALGVSIVSCYLTNDDVASPRSLVADPGGGWPDGAVTLYRMASRLDPTSELSHYLLRQGWHVEPEAACFIQVNHSEVLDEFVGLLTSPAAGAYATLPKGR